MDSFFGVRARNVKEFYRIVGFLKPIVYICVKENKGVCYDALFDKSFSVTIETYGNVRDTLASIEMFTPLQILSMTI